MNTILELPVDLKERRSVLESELQKVVVEICFTGLREQFIDLFAEYGVANALSVSWGFYGEYDDEGGTDWCPTGITVETEEGVLEKEEYKINKKSKWSNEIYEYTLDEELHELIYDFKRDLYDNNITEITL